MDNGHIDHSQRFERMEAKIDALEGELGSALKGLTTAITQLANKIDSVRDAVPLKVVAWMFMILVLTVSGLEGVKVLGKYLTGAP